MIRRAFLSTIASALALPLAPFAAAKRQTYRLGRWPPLHYNEATMAVVQGVKDSTKPTGLTIDWLAWNDCPPGEPQA